MVLRASLRQIMRYSKCKLGKGGERYEEQEDQKKRRQDRIPGNLLCSIGNIGVGMRVAVPDDPFWIVY